MSEFSQRSVCEVGKEGRGWAGTQEEQGVRGAPFADSGSQSGTTE